MTTVERIAPASDFVRRREEASTLAPGYSNVDAPEFLIGCPACHHVSGEEISHGESVTCHECGLKITLYGNSLELER